MHLTNFRREKYLHGLVNNAGIMATPFEKTVDGYESQFQVSSARLEIPNTFPVHLKSHTFFIDQLSLTLAVDLLSTADNAEDCCYVLPGRRPHC